MFPSSSPDQARLNRWLLPFFRAIVDDVYDMSTVVHHIGLQYHSVYLIFHLLSKPPGLAVCSRVDLDQDNWPASQFLAADSMCPLHLAGVLTTRRLNSVG